MPRDQEFTRFRRLLLGGQNGPSVEEKIALIAELRREDASAGAQIDRLLVQTLHDSSIREDQFQDCLREAREALEKMQCPPYFPATFVRWVDTQRGSQAMVQLGPQRRVVSLAPGFDFELAAGDEVYLDSDLIFVVEPSSGGTLQVGETASFEHMLPDGRMVVTSRGDRHVVTVAAALSPLTQSLKSGSLVLWSRELQMALGQIDRQERQQYMFTKVPLHLDRSCIGGQSENLERVISTVMIACDGSGTANTFDVSGQNTIMLIGPSGTGKTLIVKIAIAEITRLTGQQFVFVTVKPGQFESPWVGETQQRIREFFAECREAAEELPVVIYMDEGESNARQRGIATNVHGDKGATALMVELDGLEDRGNITLIVSSNRKDLMDPALLRRLSDQEIVVNRPDMNAAREIFGIHLRPTVPYYPNSTYAEKTRTEIIETAVSRFYSPNADSDLCTLLFRDGKTRLVKARDLASGRIFAQICKLARMRAYHRAKRGGLCGLELSDMEEALCSVIERLATDITPLNCHAHLTDLPRDVDVIDVKPVVRRVKEQHRYIRMA